MGLSRVMMADPDTQWGLMIGQNINFVTFYCELVTVIYFYVPKSGFETKCENSCEFVYLLPPTRCC